MSINKLDPRIQLTLRYERLVSPLTKQLFEEDGKWNIIIQHASALKEIEEVAGTEATVLGREFALLSVEKDRIIPLSNLLQTIYIAFPKAMTYAQTSLKGACIEGIQSEDSLIPVTGKGVLIAVIDSGIDYSHPAFLTEDGKTRIAAIWDQSKEGTSPLGFDTGAQYTREMINEALEQPTKEERLNIVPTTDFLGHGTAVSSVAAGNDLKTPTKYLGIAPGAELLVVKLGKKEIEPRPLDSEVMLGMKYAIQKSRQLKLPVSIMIGLGYNLGRHDGYDLIETYISQITQVSRSSFSVSTGNEANQGHHYAGKIEEDEEQTLQLFISEHEINYACTLWKPSTDDIDIKIISPKGEQTPWLTSLDVNNATVLGNTAVLVNFSDPIIDPPKQEIFIWFQENAAPKMDTGVWTISLRGRNVLDGNYNIWGAIPPQGSETQFLRTTVETTLTIPSSERDVLGMGAFDARTMQMAAFSGRGYTALNKVKPNVVAPGVNVLAASIKPDAFYEMATGTSISAAFMAGGYALLMEYGIYQLEVPYLHGFLLSLYVIRSALRPERYAPYPNKQWGYGILCIERALKAMQETAPILLRGQVDD